MRGGWGCVVILGSCGEWVEMRVNGERGVYWVCYCGGFLVDD